MESEVLREIAEIRGKTVAQVALRWLYEQGVIVVAKSFNKGRMKENLEILDWELTQRKNPRKSMRFHRVRDCQALNSYPIMGPTNP
ncbi:hypothetical protein AAC387_Pa01g1447 [Persea americana]